MALRLEPFITGNIYHVFNRAIDERPIFKINAICMLLLQLWEYYRSTKARISFSQLKKLDKEMLEKIRREIMYKKYFRVDILAYCLMPTHFHLLLKQGKDNGIPRFISNTINALTRSFNLRNGRKGPVFLPKFKSVKIQTDEQFVHVSRYIHLNPYSGGVVKKIVDLVGFPWSSFKEYFSDVYNKKISVVNTDTILAMFGENRTKYKKFVYSNAQHQKTLEQVKYAEKWEI